MARVIELEFFVDCPSTSMIAVRHKLDYMEKFAMELALYHHGSYNGNVTVENGEIRATVEYKTETEAKNAVKKTLNSKYNHMKTVYPQLKGIRYPIRAVN